MRILSQMEMDCMEALQTFMLYSSAIKDLGYLEPLHKVGHQALCAGAVTMAGEVYEKYKELYFAMFKDGEVIYEPTT